MADALERVLGSLARDPEVVAFARQILGPALPFRRAQQTGVRPSQPLVVEREYGVLTQAVVEVTNEAIERTVLTYVRREVTGDGVWVDELDPEELDRLLLELRALSERVRTLDVTSRIEEISRRIAQWNAADMADVLGVPVDTNSPGVVAALEPWRREQAVLIRDLTTQQVERVTAIIEEAQATGTRVEQVAKQLERELGISRRRAQTIATDQVLTANARLTQEQHRDAGVYGYDWSTAGDDRVRPEHERVDGETFRWDGRGAPGAGVKGAPAHPGEAILCRCTAIPNFDVPARGRRR